ncbi:MAG: SPASM domain-containing protein [Kiritimatiellae bacterium]|nr:SPASM domain-containing protein [Kiritimatiellia bacterium]
MAEKKEGDKFKGLPASAVTTAIMFGRGYIFKLAARMLWGYKRDFFYILRKFGWRSATSFLYTKLCVPCGEGSGSGIYFVLSPVVRKWPALAPFPRYLELEHTTICNKRCIMCEHTFWQDQPERHTTFEDFKGMIDQFPGLRWLHLTGEGSSYLNPDFMRMMEYVRREKKAALYIVDHFADLTDTELRHMVEIGLFGVYVSIDAATKETYDRIRLGCNWNNVQRNIRRLIEIKKEMGSPLPEIVVRLTVLKENVHEVASFLDMVAEFATPENRKWVGSGGVRVEYVGNLEFKEIKEQSVYALPDDLLEQAVAKTRKYKFNTFFFHTEVGKLPSIEQCYAWLEPYILDGGYVLPCCQVLMSNKRKALREHAFGNLHELTFTEIWNSERYRRFRKNINDMKQPVPWFCATCRGFAVKDRLAKVGADPET